MHSLKARVRERLAGLHLDPVTEAETIEELSQHVEDRFRDLRASGVPEESAAAQAWRELEGHPRLSREISSARARPPATPAQELSRGGLAAVWDDLVFAWRRLRHAPGFTAVALVTVMLTVGANTAILSVADAVLLRPLPYDDPDQVAIIQVKDPKTGRQTMLTPFAYLQAINDQCPSVSDVGVIDSFAGRGTPPVRPTLDTADGRIAVPAVEVTANYFQILGVRAAAGRLFDAADAGREGVVALLTYSAWREMLGGDEGAVGRPLTLGAVTFEIVGVLPKGFIFPTPVERPSLVVLRRPPGPAEDGGTFHPIVRIADGVSRERAQAEVEAAAASVVVSNRDGRVNAELPQWTGVVPVLNGVRDLLYPVGRPIMRYLLAAAAFILLLGCANLATMMVVRGRRDLRETAVRMALGANRARLIRPILFEALTVSAIGAVLAVTLASLSFDALLRQVPPAAYGRANVGVTDRVVLLSLGMGLFCALSFSVIPAWRTAGIDVSALMQRRGGPNSPVRFGWTLVSLQVGIALAVVFGATLAGRAFVSILRTPLGFSSERVVRVTPGRTAGMSGADYRITLDRVIDTLAGRADIEAVGAVGSMPFSGRAPDDGFRAADGGPLEIGIVYALPGYLETVGLTPRRGRVWARDEARTNPDALILSASAARARFGDKDPIGATLDNGRGRLFHVIGVVDDVRNAIDRSTLPLAYAIPPPGRGALMIVARARSQSASVLSGIKEEARREFAVGVTTVEWLDDVIASNNGYRNPRFQTLVLAGLATLALGLTALGIFSVVAYLVAARTREMGVRLAIGASPASLVAMMVRQAAAPVAAGLMLGGLLIWWGRELAEAQLFQLDTADPVTVAAAVTSVVIASLGAAFLPARRAGRVNPTDVLRAE